MWAQVEAELDVWRRERRRALFWWRDDDATEVTPQLDRLLGLAGRFDVPVALAVVPMSFTRRLARRVGGAKNLEVLVHGYRHINHAPPGAPKREFAGWRDRDTMARELTDSLRRTREGFGPQALPVFVPPWNRVPRGLALRLPGLGYGGLSTWKPVRDKDTVEGLTVVNTHLDPIDWRRGGTAKSEAVVASLVLRKLRWRRLNPLRAREPLGLLTHHLRWTPEHERVIAQLLVRTRSHPAVRWISPRAAFGLKIP